MPADNIRGSAQEHLNDEISAWMSANYGDGILAPLTGTDWRAMRALVYAWDLRPVLDLPGISPEPMQRVR